MRDNPTRGTEVRANQRVHWSAPAVLGCGVAAALAFHAAYRWESARVLMGVFLFCVLMMARTGSARLAFYGGLGLGMAVYGPQLGFFYTIFGSAAVALWSVLAFWLGLFVWLAHRGRERFGDGGLALLAPFLWTGLEYFRSELYPLRFSWANIGYAFSGVEEGTAMLYGGVYGVGFLLMTLAAVVSVLPRWPALAVGLLGLGGTAWVAHFPAPHPEMNVAGGNPLKVAGIQAEFPLENEVPGLLDRVLFRHPEADLLVLSEYTFDGPVPELTRKWCRKHQKHLIVGGKDPVPGGQFINTAFVIDPTGQVVFRQGKRVPIQFFKDGLPAPTQAVWDSPWGKLGICICYDLSYRRVVEGLFRLGAQAIIVPTMDVADWGEHQHRLNARIGPARAREFGVPVIRLASSGISQWIDASGGVRASAPFRGQEETLYGAFELRAPNRVPFDIWLGPVSVLVTGGFILASCFPARKRRFEMRPPSD